MKKVLIVEDEPTLAEMYRDIFAKNEFEAHHASSVNRALEIVKEEKPDIILLDILLPGETGISFLIKLRRLDGVVSETMVVAFSNYDDKETKEEAFDLGVKDYLIKTDNTPREILQKSVKYLEK